MFFKSKSPAASYSVAPPIHWPVMTTNLKRKLAHGLGVDHAAVSRAGVADGPRNLEELFQYPMRHVDIILASDDRKSTLVDNFNRTLRTRSHYSGSLGQEFVLDMIESELVDRGLLLSQVHTQCVHACDVKPACQRVAHRAHVSPCMPICYFNNSLERMPTGILKFFEAMEPDQEMKLYDKERAQQMCTNANAAFGEYVYHHKLELFTEETVAPCILCKKMCLVKH